MTAREIQNITILGTGNMGPGVAVLFAKHGYSVTVWAHSPSGSAKAETDCKMIVDDLCDAGLLIREKGTELLREISITEDLTSAVKLADFISESIVENLEAKVDLFAKIQNTCPAHTIIASNTSTLLPSSLQENLLAPENVVVAHFWNPAHLVPLVEICGGSQTSPDVVQTTSRLLKLVGKTPVVMEKEILGFIGNRLMHAMYREALSLVHEGVISAEGIDQVVLASFGPRFANLGPLEYFDYIGLDHIQRIQNYLYGDLDSRGGSSAAIDGLVSEGNLGLKTGSGLYDWSGKDANDVRTRRDAEMVRRLRDTKKPG